MGTSVVQEETAQVQETLSASMNGDQAVTTTQWACNTINDLKRGFR